MADGVSTQQVNCCIEILKQRFLRKLILDEVQFTMLVSLKHFEWPPLWGCLTTRWFRSGLCFLCQLSQFYCLFLPIFSVEKGCLFDTPLWVYFIMSGGERAVSVITTAAHFAPSLTCRLKASFAPVLKNKQKKQAARTATECTHRFCFVSKKSIKSNKKKLLTRYAHFITLVFCCLASFVVIVTAPLHTFMTICSKWTSVKHLKTMQTVKRLQILLWTCRGIKISHSLF